MNHLRSKHVTSLEYHQRYNIENVLHLIKIKYPSINLKFAIQNDLAKELTSLVGFNEEIKKKFYFDFDPTFTFQKIFEKLEPELIAAMTEVETLLHPHILHNEIEGTTTPVNKFRIKTNNFYHVRPKKRAIHPAINPKICTINKRKRA